MPVREPCRRAAHGHAIAAFFRAQPERPKQHALGVVGDPERRPADFRQRRFLLFSGFRQIGERFPNIALALMENGAYDKDGPSVHMTPEESIRAFQDLRAKTLYNVHKHTFDLAFHPWREPMDRLAELAARQGIDLPIDPAPAPTRQTRPRRKGASFALRFVHEPTFPQTRLAHPAA